MRVRVKRASGAAPRRRVAVAGVLAVVMGTAVAFTAAQALATPGSAGAVSTYMARGPVSQSVVIGTSQDRDNHEDRAGPREGQGRHEEGELHLPDRDADDDLRNVHRMRYGLPTADDPARWIHRLAHSPRADLRGRCVGEGTLYHAMSGCPSVKYATGAGFMQPSTEVHNMRNEGSAPLVLWAFYALPPGTTNAAIRIDQPQPAECPNIP